MSYSYLQSVFPNYRPSQKLTELIYNDIINNNVVKEPSKYEAANDTKEHVSISQVNSKPLIVEQKEQEKSSENIETTEVKKEEKTFLETFKDNLKFYNEPINPAFLEEFENLDKKSVNDVLCKGESCVDNINHILKCESCSVILKQKLGIKNDYSEFLEMIMYILFGLFIIAILDKLDRR